MQDSQALQTRADARRQGLIAIAGVVIVGGLIWFGWHWLQGRHFERTDNAYVAGHVVQITPQVAGTVAEVLAEDTDFVRAGQVLVRLDGADADVALQKAQSELAQIVRNVRALFADNATLQAQVQWREADLAKAQAQLASAQDDVNRRTPLLQAGAVGKEEFEHTRSRLVAARTEVASAESALNAARQALQAGQARTDGTTVEQHPSVQSAMAKVREAWLNRQRLDLVAPQDGHVAKRGVQLGQRVQAGAPLLTMVALHTVWVDANFKESQLRALRIGQPATLKADVYGDEVTYHGKVVGLSAGTGSAFALLPAQNATGNWVKIVQRVPVRIALDAEEVAAHPLRVGLSMDVSVETRDRSGKVLADAPREASNVERAAQADPRLKAVDADIRRIIAENLGVDSAKRPQHKQGPSKAS